MSKSFAPLLASIISLLIPFVSMAASNGPSSPTKHTLERNKAFAEQLPFNNRADFDSSQKGFVTKPKELKLVKPNGYIAWDINKFTSFQGIDTPAPDTVNKSLWRMARLNSLYGLYKVVDGIHQIRGYDLAVMSIIDGKTGYIIVDPLTTVETSTAAMELVYENLGKKPVTAVIYTHSHVDHFGGVKGVVDIKDVEDGKVKIFAPEGFMDSAVDENVLAGNAMTRRSFYMYGNLLPVSAVGVVDAGLGKTVAQGPITLIPPTDIISGSNDKRTIDGIEFVFQFAPDTEAPSEMMFFLPQHKALCMAENATHTIHNLYTLRGAKVRDSMKWANALTQSIEQFGSDTEVVFASHHWPTWGNEQVLTFLNNQRDTYKYIHDQTLRLANHGYNPQEIAEMLTLPPALGKQWYNRGYYGTMSHDIKAVYQTYLGWFDGNPANLNPLPPVPTSKHIVEYMGGADAIMEKAQWDYQEGEYRWVAQVLNYLVYAQPDNQKARDLLAETYDQLGYMAESGPWRNFYLTGAMELRDGVNRLPKGTTGSPDIVAAMNLDMVYDYISIKLNGPKAEGFEITLNTYYPDIDKHYMIRVNNSVLHYYENKQADDPDVAITLDRKTLNNLILGHITGKEGINDGSIKLEGNKDKLLKFFSLLDHFDVWFNIVTPRPVTPDTSGPGANTN